MKTRALAKVIGFLIFLAIYSSNHLFLPPKLRERLWDPPPGKSAINCDRSHYNYDSCTLNDPTVLLPTISTLLVVGLTNTTQPMMEKIRPYPRKWEKPIMAHIKEITISTTTSQASCQVHHHAPALVFSTGGYVGNFFHDFVDSLIPLYITTRLLALPPVLVIANCHLWWLSKYADLLRHLTPHPIINLDEETNVHCFPSATVGLVSHGFASIKPSLMPNSESLSNFHAFLEQSCTLADHHPSPADTTDRPRLALIARAGSVGRAILNEPDVVHVAEDVGFKVIVFKPTSFTPLREAYQLMNKTQVMFGVHGAALSHAFFLRPGAVLIQVVPIGLEWAAEICYGQPARQMGLDYVEYRIKTEESSLMEKYGKDDEVLKNPTTVVKKGWSNTKAIYLEKQDVRLDLDRVRAVLEAAYKNATRRLMKREFFG